MTLLSFLGQRTDLQKQFLVDTAHNVIVRSAIDKGLIKEETQGIVTLGELAYPQFVNLAAKLREDFYAYRDKTKKQLQFPLLQFPLINSCFCYAFAKGAEFAYLRTENKSEFTYLFDDAISGAAGAQVNDDFAKRITLGMKSAYNVFCDFQKKVLIQAEYWLQSGGQCLPDMIACGFYWASLVGFAYGMANVSALHADAMDTLLTEAETQGWLPGRELSLIPEILPIFNNAASYFLNYIEEQEPMRRETLMFHTCRYLFAKGVEGVILWGAAPKGKISVYFHPKHLLGEIETEVPKHLHQFVLNSLPEGESLFRVHQKRVLDLQKSGKPVDLHEEMKTTLTYITRLGISYGLFHKYQELR